MRLFFHLVGILKRATHLSGIFATFIALLLNVSIPQATADWILSTNDESRNFSNLMEWRSGIERVWAVLLEPEDRRPRQSGDAREYPARLIPEADLCRVLLARHYADDPLADRADHPVRLTRPAGWARLLEQDGNAAAG